MTMSMLNSKRGDYYLPGPALPINFVASYSLVTGFPGRALLNWLTVPATVPATELQILLNTSMFMDFKLILQKLFGRKSVKW
jgi:hypothetical protein